MSEQERCPKCGETERHYWCRCGTLIKGTVCPMCDRTREEAMEREHEDDSIPFACGTEITPDGRVILEGEVCLRRQLAQAQAEIERLRRERAQAASLIRSAIEWIYDEETGERAWDDSDYRHALEELRQAIDLLGGYAGNESAPRKAVATVSDQERLTPELLSELRRIAEAATPGPWAWRMSKDGRILDLITIETGYNEEIITPSHINAWLQVKDGLKDFIPAFAPATALALLDEIERLRREREALVKALMPASEALADLDQSYYRVARQDPAGYVMGSVSVASLVTVIESTRKALALFDDEKGGDADE